MKVSSDSRPLIVHVMYRFDVGGLENGVVNLINHMPPERYRHAVVALTEITEFKNRIRRHDVEFIALNKAPGHSVKLYPRLYRLFRKMRPAIVHTRNLAALEATVPAWAAGVRVRIHGEHGRDVGDPHGTSRKYQWIRRLYRPFVTQYVAVSRDLESYLTTRIGVPATKVMQVYNGVDAHRFRPADAIRAIEGGPFNDHSLWVLGHVGRNEAVKDQVTLARAFIRALRIDPSQRGRLRLIIVGDGPLRRQIQMLLEQAGVANLTWLPGERADVDSIMRGFDCFVLPSLGEGISNTILEAMASALPVIATDVGGNRELVQAGETGQLVPPADPEALAHRILAYARDPAGARRAGSCGRVRVERVFSLDAMIERYSNFYDAQLGSTAALIQRVGAV